jgi:hypothetical protein
MRPAVIAALLLAWAAPAQVATGPRIEFPLARFVELTTTPQPPSAQRVTLLLNVGSLVLRRGSFSGGADHMLIYAAISALSHGAAAVRLVVFDADRQHELLRREAFALADLNQVTAAMEKWRLGPVDYHALQRGDGSVDIVAGLINEQLRADPPPDMVVFVDPGPWERVPDRSARKALEIPRGVRPRFFALQFGPSAASFGWGRGRSGGRSAPPRPDAPADSPRVLLGPGPGGGFPSPSGRDKIRPAVARLDGKTFFMNSPGQLSKAIAEIEERAGGKP